jgi:cytochrome c-type biogenesis protein CcmH/NrfF
LRSAAALLLAGLAAAVPSRAADPAPAAREQQAVDIEEGLMCYCGCTDLTVRVCNCGVAAEIKSDIRQRLASGQSSEEVVAAYVARHGAQIRSAPTRRGFDLLAWSMPFVAVFAAGWMVVSLIRRWRHAPHPPPTAADHAAAPKAASLDRVDRAVRDIL